MKTIRAGEKLERGSVVYMSDGKYYSADNTSPLHTGIAMTRPQPQYVRTAKSKGIAILLALCFGGVGAHKFYMGQIGRGFLYLLFFWTFVPLILSCVDIFRIAVCSDDAFQKRCS